MDLDPHTWPPLSKRYELRTPNQQSFCSLFGHLAALTLEAKLQSWAPNQALRPNPAASASTIFSKTRQFLF
jgi:hypothetical protein